MPSQVSSSYSTPLPLMTNRSSPGTRSETLPEVQVTRAYRVRWACSAATYSRCWRWEPRSVRTSATVMLITPRWVRTTWSRCRRTGCELSYPRPRSLLGRDSHACRGGPLDREPGDVPLHERVEPRDVGRVRLGGRQAGAGEDRGVQVVGQALFRRASGDEGGQDGDSPGATLGSDVTDGDRGVDRGGQEALRYALGPEQAAVREHPVEPHALGLLQDVHPDPQCGQGREQMRPHEGGEVEPAVRGAQEERPALLEVGDRLPGEVVVGEHPAAVAGTAQCGSEEGLEDRRRVDLGTQRPSELGEQPGPGVQFTGPVVAVHHGHRVAGRRGDQVQFAVRPGELPLEHDHGEDARPGGNVAGARS